MDKEKQIKEMSQIMHDGCAIVRATNQCRGEDCLDCGAVNLYEKGYRKASDVAREIFEEINRRILDGTINVRNHLKYSDLKKKYTESEDTE